MSMSRVCEKTRGGVSRKDRERERERERERKKERNRAAARKEDSSAVHKRIFFF